MDLFRDKLVEQYQKILKNNPKSKVFSPLAEILYRRKEPLKAKELCLQGIKHNPDYAKGYLILARILFKEDELDSSLKLLNKARALEPQQHEIYELLVDIYQKQSRFQNVYETYKILAFLKPEDRLVKKTLQQLEKSLDTKTQLDSRPSLQKQKKMKKLMQMLSHIDSL